MDFFECLHQYLMQNEEIQQKVGDRIYPFSLPQNATLPSIVYTPISANYPDALQRHTGFVKQIVQFSVHNTTFGKARKTGRIVKELLQDFSGDMCGINIQATHLLNDLSSDKNSMTNFDMENYIRIIEFRFEYMEKQ